ncbi:MAG TPA: type II toxin-antitoxin system VapC family toxin [Thermoanaerobaculia bacterium]|nr:type II toxin-antitoxin system VapC family toxin [Thermoanaerobaculia bacterium]
MRILLDTHCWLWMQASPRRFGASSLELVQSLDNELLLSAASAWEISIKSALGRLVLPEPAAVYVPKRMETSGVTGLVVEHAHALRVSELPPHHRDPFDRLLVAQAQVESLPILTADPQLARYDVEIFEA